MSAKITVTYFELDGVEEGSGNAYGLDIDGAPYRYEVWATTNSGGTALYDTSDPDMTPAVMLDEEVHEAIDASVEAFDTIYSAAYERAGIGALLLAVSESAIAEASSLTA